MALLKDLFRICSDGIDFSFFDLILLADYVRSSSDSTLRRNKMTDTCALFQENLNRYVDDYVAGSKASLQSAKSCAGRVSAIMAMAAASTIYFTQDQEKPWPELGVIGASLFSLMALGCGALVIRPESSTEERIEWAATQAVRAVKSAIASFNPFQNDLKSSEKRMEFWASYDMLKQLPVAVLTDKQKSDFEAAFSNYESAIEELEEAKRNQDIIEAPYQDGAIRPQQARKRINASMRKEKQLAEETNRNYVQLTDTIKKMKVSLSKIFDLIKDDGYNIRFIQNKVRSIGCK